MKKTYILILSCLAFLMVGLTPSLQAQLTAGDLAIVYFRSVNDGTGPCAYDDSVTILTLVALNTGDKFILTDQSVHDNGGANPEEFSTDGGSTFKSKAFIYTTPTGGLPAFSLITFNPCAMSSDWADYRNTYSASPYVSTLNNVANADPFDLYDGHGDQLFLFIDSNTGNATEPMAEPLFIFGMDFTTGGTGSCFGGTSTTGWDNNVAANPADDWISIEPLGLISAGASLELADNGTGDGCGVFIGAYNGPISFSSQADALSQITNASNWLEGDANNFPGPSATYTQIYARSNQIHGYGGGGNPFSGPSLVPTLSEWAMMILALMMLAMGSVAILASRKKLATAGSASFSMFAPRSLPFDGKLFAKVLAVVLAATIVGFGVAMLGFGYELMTFDVPGVLISSPIAAYVVHLWMKK